jgi:CRP-like cAMP-binding protein
VEGGRVRRDEEQSAAFRDALWVSRCVGRPESAPLRPDDIHELARFLQVRTLEPGEPLNHVGDRPSAVCIVREGCLELAVSTGSGRVVIQTLRPGSIDGDIQLLLDIPMPYETRANTATTCLLLGQEDFDRLLATHGQLSKRWLTSVAQRLARSHDRLTSLLGEPLEVQVAQLLLDESVDGVVVLPQSTLAALLGVRRPSVNRVLRKFHRAGLVHVSYGKVSVVDRAGLESTLPAR